MDKMSDIFTKSRMFPQRRPFLKDSDKDGYPDNIDNKPHQYNPYAQKQQTIVNNMKQKTINLKKKLSSSHKNSLGEQKLKKFLRG